MRLFKRKARGWKEAAKILKESPDPKVRWEAAEALAGSPAEPEILEALAEALHDEHPFVRWKAGETLLSMRGARVLSLLLELLNHKNVALKVEASRILGELKDPRAGERLCKALQSQNELVRWSAAEALANIGSQEALECLKKAANDPAWGVRRAVATALGKATTQKDKMLPLLAQLAKDSHPLVRSAAARAMGRLGSPEAEAFLLPLLQDPHPQVRAEAVWALSRTGGEEAIASLKGLLEDQELVFGEAIASKAKRAISSIRRRLFLRRIASLFARPQKVGPELAEKSW